MHQFLLNAINALINNKFADAKQWLNKLISSDITTTSPGDIAIAHYVYAYLYYLEKNKALALQHYDLVDINLIPDKTLLQFLIAPEKVAKTLLDSTKANNPTPTPQVSNSPTVSSSPHFTSPRGNLVDDNKRIVGFSPKINTPTPISNNFSAQSSSTRCAEVLQKTPDIIKTHILDKQVEKFKECHEFWKSVLKTYLLQLGLPEKTTEKNQLTLEKIFTVIAECKIPLYYLCQNLISLSKFWRIEGETNSDPEVDEELKPAIAPLIIGTEPKTPDAKSPPVRGSLAKLLAATAKQSPAANINGSTPKDIERTSSASLSSSTSSNSKESVHSNHTTAKLLNQSQPINPPVLKPAAMPSSQKALIASPPVPITIPSAAQTETNNTYSETYIPHTDRHAAPDFLTDEELAKFISAGENNSEQQRITVSHRKPEPIPHTPKSVQKRESLLAKHKPTTEDSAHIAKQNTESPSVNTVLDKNKIKLKKCMIDDNCLAALMLLLSGVRDSADRFEYIPLVPNPTALEIAAYHGNTHCLALIANTNVEIDLYDRAVRLALKHNHIDCIHLLLDHVSFSAKANMYLEIESNPNQKLQKLRELLLNSHLTLYKALQNDCKILIPELICSSVKETPDEINGIIMRAAELGYDSCLTESRLKDADIEYISLALINAAKNNHIDCIAKLLETKISSKVKINALIVLMKYIQEYCKENLPEHKWLQYYLAEKSFIFFLYVMNNLEIQTAFIEIAKTADPLFVRVLLKLDKLSLVQVSHKENPLCSRMFLKLDKAALEEISSTQPEAILAIRELKSTDNIENIIEIYNLIKKGKVQIIKIDKIIHISNDCKKTAFLNALKQWKIDVVLSLFNTGLDIKDEEDAIKKIASGSNINYQGKLVEYALNNPFTLALLLKLKVNLPSKTAPGVTHKVTELANLDCLRLLLDNGFDINKVDEFLLTKKIASNTESSSSTNNTTSPNVLSMSSLSSLRNIMGTAPSDKKIIVSTGTIVMIATYLGHADCLEYLLNRGTGLNDPRNPPDLRIQLPANCYFKSQRLTIATPPPIHNAQDNTVINNADDINTCFSGYSVLHFAVNHPNCLELLIQAMQLQVDKNLKEMLALKTTSGDTPLHTAALNNKYKSVIILLKAGADPFQVNKTNEIPLVSAIRVVAKDAYDVFMNNKAIFENRPAPLKVLKEMFESSVKLSHTARLTLIADCLFSNKINWSNQVEIIELFQSLLHIIVRHNNLDALNIFKPYINKYFKLGFNISDLSIEDSFVALSQHDNYMKIIQFAINKKSWEIAKSLLEHISSQQHFKAAVHMKDEDAVIFLLKLNELIELIPKEETKVSLNLNP